MQERLIWYTFFVCNDDVKELQELHELIDRDIEGYWDWEDFRRQN